MKVGLIVPQFGINATKENLPAIIANAIKYVYSIKFILPLIYPIN